MSNGRNTEAKGERGNAGQYEHAHQTSHPLRDSSEDGETHQKVRLTRYDVGAVPRRRSHPGGSVSNTSPSAVLDRKGFKALLVVISGGSVKTTDVYDEDITVASAWGICRGHDVTSRQSSLS